MLHLLILFFFKKIRFCYIKSSKVTLINHSYIILIDKFKYLVLITFICNFSYSQNYNLSYSGIYKNSRNNSFEKYEHLIKSIDDSISSLIDRGFMYPKVERLKKRDSFNYEVTIVSGSKIKFIKISNIENLSADFKKHIYNLLDTKRRIEFGELKKFLNNLSLFISANGYPFSKINIINLVQLDSNLISADLNIELGQKRKIDKIVIKGYKNFPKKFFKNFLNINEKVDLDLNYIKKKSSKIDNLLFVKNTKDPEVLFTEDSTIVYFYFKKVKKSSLDGFIGINTDENTNKLDLQGNLNLNVVNAFNSGEEINIRYISENSQDKLFYSNLEIPFLFSSPISIGLSLNLSKKDSTFSTNSRGINLHSELKKINFGVGYEKINSSAYIQNENIMDFNLSKLNFFISKNQMDYSDVLYQKKLEFFYNYSSGEKSQEIATPYSSHEFKLLKKLNFSKRLLNISKFNYNKMNSENFVTNELFRYGGINSIRGFLEGSIYANEYFITNFDLIFLLNKSTAIFSLFDFSKYRNISLNLNEKIYSAGLGLKTVSNESNITIFFASGNTWGKKLNPRDAKISISFKTFF